LIPTSTLGSLVIREPDYGTSSRAIARISENEIKYVRITDFNNHGILENNEFTTVEEFDEKYLLEVGDLLFARSGATVGKTYLYDGEIGKAVFAGYCIRFRFDLSKVNPYFIFYNTKTKRYLTWIASIQRPSGQPNINKEEFKSFTIPVPSLETQEKLVSQLELASASRREKLVRADELSNGLDAWLLEQIGYKRSEIIDRSVFAVELGSIGKRLDAYANKSRFRKLFQNLSNMRIEKLSDLSLEIFSGTTPTAGGDAYVDPPDGVAFVRSGEIGKDGLVRPTHEIHIAEEVHEKTMKRSQLRNGDVLIAIVGATIGAVGVYSSPEPANINQAIAAIRLKDKISPEYLAAYISSSLGQEILDYFKRPVARANINLEEIGQMPIIVVARSIQDQISNERSRLRKEAENLRAEAETEWQTAKQQFENSLLHGAENEI
jgi:type I restriction enzyme, S subunit